MDGLGGDVFALEIAVGDGGSDVVEVHGFFASFEDDVDFVADVFGVDSRPFGETPEAVKSGELFGDAGDGGDLRRVFVGELIV